MVHGPSPSGWSTVRTYHRADDDTRRPCRSPDPSDRADRLRRLRGEARGGPARRRAAGLGARAEPDELIAGLDAGRRRRRLPDQRRARDHRHARLLPAARRRRPDVRRDRGRERAERRVRDGWPRPVRALDRGVPRGAAAGHAGGRSSTAPRAKVREAGGTLAGGHTIRDPEPKYGLAVIGAAHPDRLLRKGGARPGDTLILTKRLGTGRARQRPSPGQGRARRTSPRAIDQMRVLNRAAVGGARRRRDRRRDRRDRASACSATGSRWPGRRGRGSSSRRRRCRRSTGALELAAAGVETGGAAHNRRFVLPALDRRRGRRAGARDARPRPADLRRAAGRGAGRSASPRSRPGLGDGRRRALVDRPGRGDRAGASRGGRPRSRDRRADPGLQRGAADRRGRRGDARAPAGHRRRRRLDGRDRRPGAARPARR